MAVDPRLMIIGELLKGGKTKPSHREQMLAEMLTPRSDSMSVGASTIRDMIRAAPGDIGGLLSDDMKGGPQIVIHEGQIIMVPKARPKASKEKR